MELLFYAGYFGGGKLFGFLIINAYLISVNLIHFVVEAVDSSRV